MWVSIVRNQDTAVFVTSKFDFVWINLVHRNDKGFTIDLEDRFTL